MKKFIVIASIFSAMAIAAAGISKGPPQETTRTDGQPKAIVKFKPEPHYPEEARKRRIEATIVLRAIFRASRDVTDIKFDKVIPKNLPEDIVKALTKEAIEAARKIKFEPAMKDGHPVSMYVQLEYNFRLD
jgi:TonB family protein